MDSTIGTAFQGLIVTVVALAIVLGLAYLFLRALKQWQDRGLGKLGGKRGNEPERRLRFVRALPLGPRERLVLVEAEGELMLIGVSGGSVALLRNWGSDLPVDVPPDESPLAASRTGATA